jgi:hypothetical protein
MPAQQGFYDALSSGQQLSDADERRFQLRDSNGSVIKSTKTSGAPTAPNTTTIDHLAGSAVTISSVTGTVSEVMVQTRDTSTSTPPFNDHYLYSVPSTAVQGGNVTINNASVSFPNESGAVNMVDSTNYGTNDGSLILFNDINGSKTQIQREANLSPGSPGVSRYRAVTSTTTITNTGTTFNSLDGIAFDVTVNGSTTRVSEGPLTKSVPFGSNSQLTLTQYTIQFT